MRRGAKPAKANIETGLPGVRKPRRHEGSKAQNPEKRLAEAFAQQAATAEILRAIGESHLDPQPAFEAIADSAMRLFSARTATVFRLDGEFLHALAARGGPAGSGDAAVYRRPVPVTRDFVSSRCIVDRSVVHVADVQTDPDAPSGTRQLAVARGFRAALCVPLMRNAQPIGTIAVSRAEPGHFSDGEIALLQTFADQAAIAIENARIFTELQDKNRALARAHAEVTEALEQQTATADILRVISSSPTDTQPVFDAIASRVVRLCDAYFSTVWRYDGTLIHHAADNYPTRQMREILTRGYPAPAQRGSAVAEAIDEGRIVHVEDLLDGAAPAASREVALALGYRTLLCVPMLRDGVSIGAIAVARREPRPFADRQIELVKTFASQAVIAIENVRLFNELQARNREVEAQSRELEAASRHKSEFLANMSHELRTPLNAILGFSEVLGERMFGELNDKQDEYLRDIHASGQHLLSLINDILDLSKIEAGRMELALSEFSLEATLENALTLVRERAARHGIAVQGTTDARVGQVRADERKIRQVVLNLLSNAIKFTPAAGRIDVSAVPGDGVVEVSVSDTGVGIEPGDQETIFEEFRQVGTAAKKVEGTGLGLALSRKFVELHGGRIWVQSQVGIGSRFTFTIPVWR